jgi:uncharacterized membrane protein
MVQPARFTADANRRAANWQNAPSSASWRVRLVWTGVAVLVLIGIAAATIRGLRLLFGAAPAPQTFDAGFAQHPILTFVHIIPGALFMLLGPFQFMPSIRARRLWQHRWSGRVFVGAGYIIGVSALVMTWHTAIGGTNERAAIVLFDSAFLFSLTKAVSHIRHGQILQHREWMLRAFGIGLGVATTRPIVGAFFAARRLAPQEFFGIAFWLGFTVTALAAEIWVNVTRAKRPVVGEPASALPGGSGRLHPH